MRARINAWRHGLITGSLFCLLSLLAPQAKSSQASDYDLVQEHISIYIAQTMRTYALTGVSIALIDDQDIVWSQGFGYADQEASIPATENTVYRVGSLSKLVTVTAIMQLYEHSKLALDLPIQTYIPEFTIKSRFSEHEPLTIRSILMHRSGITRDTSYPLPLQQGKTFREVISILQNSYLEYPPNTQYSYSNAAIDVLGVVIERVSGMTFDDFITTHILEPLGMHVSSFSFHDPPNSLLSRHYRQHMEVSDSFTKIMPHGSFLSSVTDMSHFIMMTHHEGIYAKNRFLHPETLQALLQLQHEHIHLEIGFPEDILWFLAPSGAIHTLKIGSRVGALLMNRSALILLPKQKLGVVALTNSDTDIPVIRDIAVETIKSAFEIKTGMTIPDRPEAQIITLSESDIQHYEGYYATTDGLTFIVKRDHQLQINLSGFWYPLIPYDDGYLVIQGKHARLILKTLHKREMLVLEYTDRLVTGERYTKHSLSVQWLKRIGTYKITESGQLAQAQIYAMTFETIEGILVLNTEGTKLVVNPVSDNEAVVLGGDTHGFFNRLLRFEDGDDGEILLLDNIPYTRVGK